MHAFFCPPSEEFEPNKGSRLEDPPYLWRRHFVLRNLQNERGSEEELDISHGWRCFRAYSEAAQKTVRFEVCFLDEYSSPVGAFGGACVPCCELRDVVGYWNDPSCFEKEPSCSLFAKNEIIEHKINEEFDPFESSVFGTDGHPIFLRDCDLSVLPSEDHRRKNNVQPFPLAVYERGDDVIPLKMRICRSKERFINKYVVFVRLPRGVTARDVQTDPVYWSIQNMCGLSDVCVGGAMYPYCSLSDTYKYYSGKLYPMRQDNEYQHDDKNYFCSYRFDEKGNIVERDLQRKKDLNKFTTYVCDDRCRLFLRKPDVPKGTAFSFEDYEWVPDQSLYNVQKGSFLYNYCKEKDCFEAKYLLTERPNVRRRFIRITYVFLPEDGYCLVPEAENKDKNFVHRIYDRHYVRGGEKMKAVLDHWDDESWFELKRKEGELAFWPSLSVEELLGVISVEEAKKRGFAIEGETSKIEDKKEEPKAKSTIQYSEGAFGGK